MCWGSIFKIFVLDFFFCLPNVNRTQDSLPQQSCRDINQKQHRRPYMDSMFMPFPNSSIKDLTPSVAVLGDGTSKKLIKVELGQNVTGCSQEGGPK